MPITRKPLEIPLEVARQFAAKMRKFHAEDAWFEENDPEGVAFEYPVIEPKS